MLYLLLLGWLAVNMYSMVTSTTVCSLTYQEVLLLSKGYRTSCQLFTFWTGKQGGHIYVKSQGEIQCPCLLMTFGHAISSASSLPQTQQRTNYFVHFNKLVGIQHGESKNLSWLHKSMHNLTNLYLFVSLQSRYQMESQHP